MPRRPLIAVLVVSASWGLAGCGADPQPAAPVGQAAAEAPKGVVVALEASQFAPATITARVGEEITFANRDGIAHTATAASGATFDSGTIVGGGSFSIVPSQPGRIALVCLLHPGMSGSIRVS